MRTESAGLFQNLYGFQTLQDIRSFKVSAYSSDGGRTATAESCSSSEVMRPNGPKNLLFNNQKVKLRSCPSRPALCPPPPPV